MYIIFCFCFGGLFLFLLKGDECYFNIFIVEGLVCMKNLLFIGFYEYFFYKKFGVLVCDKKVIKINN